MAAVWPDSSDELWVWRSGFLSPDSLELGGASDSCAKTVSDCVWMCVYVPAFGCRLTLSASRRAAAHLNLISVEPPGCTGAQVLAEQCSVSSACQWLYLCETLHRCWQSNLQH